MSEECAENVIEISNDYELTAYLSHNRLQVWMTVVGGIVSLGLIAAITFLSWKFSNPRLMWFLLLPTICYTLC